MTDSTMKAALFHAFGPPEVLAIEDVPPPPSPGPGQVLVAVRAAGVNHVDVAMRSGALQARLPIALPAIPGVEYSGTIVEVGPEVTDFAADEDVYSNAVANIGNGSSAQNILVPAETVAPMPRNLTFDEAASVAHGVRTAWSGLHTHGEIQPGQRVLVHGGAGGVGMYVVQMAHLAGAHVTATTSTDNLTFVADLGGDDVIDYTTTGFEDVVRDVDLV